ncbi:MAG: MSHA biogenesis protein MshK [Pseudomonadota bacterium]
MAEAVTRRAPTAFAAVAALCAALAAPAHAQVNDPTRPPAQFYMPAGANGTAPAGVPQLQSVLIALRPGGRRIAVIDGKTLRQGDRVGGAVLVGIEGTHVVLLRGKKRETLRLYRPAATSATVQP